MFDGGWDGGEHWKLLKEMFTHVRHVFLIPPPRIVKLIVVVRADIQRSSDLAKT